MCELRCSRKQPKLLLEHLSGGNEVAERSEACTVFAFSESGIVGSNPTQSMDVWCVCAFFCVCVVLCLGRGFAMSWSTVQGVLPFVNDQETEKSALCSKSGSKLPNGSKEGKKLKTAWISSDNRWCMGRDWNPVLLKVLVTWLQLDDSCLFGFQLDTAAASSCPFFLLDPRSWMDGAISSRVYTHRVYSFFKKGVVTLF
jgi:hypothetical protein